MYDFIPRHVIYRLYLWFPPTSWLIYITRTLFLFNFNHEYIKHGLYFRLASRMISSCKFCFLPWLIVGSCQSILNPLSCFPFHTNFAFHAWLFSIYVDMPDCALNMFSAYAYMWWSCLSVPCLFIPDCSLPMCIFVLNLLSAYVYTPDWVISLFSAYPYLIMMPIYALPLCICLIVLSAYIGG